MFLYGAVTSVASFFPRMVQAMVEVEIREAPRPLPVRTATGVQGDGTVQAKGAGADSSSLSREALFRAYLERERNCGRDISQEVRLGVRVGYGLESFGTFGS